jgi:hypothetical protein
LTVECTYGLNAFLMFLHSDVKMETIVDGLMTENHLKTISPIFMLLQFSTLENVLKFAKMKWVSLTTCFRLENITEVLKKFRPPCETLV